MAGGAGEGAAFSVRPRSQEKLHAATEVLFWARHALVAASMSDGDSPGRGPGGSIGSGTGTGGEQGVHGYGSITGPAMPLLERRDRAASMGSALHDGAAPAPSGLGLPLTTADVDTDMGGDCKSLQGDNGSVLMPLPLPPVVGGVAAHSAGRNHPSTAGVILRSRDSSSDRGHRALSISRPFDRPRNTSGRSAGSIPGSDHGGTGRHSFQPVVPRGIARRRAASEAIPRPASSSIGSVSMGGGGGAFASAGGIGIGIGGTGGGGLQVESQSMG